MQETDLHRLSTAKAYRDDSDGPDLDLDLNVVREAQARYRESCCERFRRCILGLDPWKLIPSILVSNAFSCSVTVLTLCTLAEVTTEGEPDPISFGLWSYSDPDIDADGNINIPSPLDRIRTCQYTPLGDASGPPQVFLDPNFRIARACGVLAVCLGFLTMAMLWLGAVRDNNSTSNWRRWVGCSLVICCLFQGMTLWVLESGVCHSVVQGKYTNCEMAHGGRTVMVACVLWFTSGVLLLKWPRKEEYRHSTLAGDENDESKNIYPEIVGFWQHLIQTLDDEQQIEVVTVGNSKPVVATQSLSTLHDIFESFDDELSVCSSNSHQLSQKRQSATTRPSTSTLLSASSGEPSGESSSSIWSVQRLARPSMEDEAASSLNPRRASLHDILGAFDEEIL